MKGLVAAGFTIFALRRFLTYLHIFQQEEYDGGRFVRWIFRSAAFDRRATAGLAALGLAEFAGVLPQIAGYILTCALFVVLAFIESDPRQSGKKRLVMTARAKRTLAAACLAAGIVVALILVVLPASSWTWIVAVQFIPFALVTGNLTLAPYESAVQRRFWREAHDKLTTIRPITIGITGSYGKTSVKHILTHILETQAPTLMTPGSINTAMGIARVVREQLKPHHRFFVCEMGAYGPGSIARLTKLAPPDLAIITAIGAAHYERFKTIETVAKAKFELAEATLQRGGKIVVAEDVLQQPGPQNFARLHKESIVPVKIDSSRQHTAGLEADVAWRGARYTLRAPLFGEHQALNLALAFTAACELGIAPEQAVIALTSVPQTSHRLEVKPQPGGWVAIDDAYNSNPVGFASGLRILDLFRGDGGRRILVTPGMVELGSAHDEEHSKIGALAAAHVDILLPVLPDRIPTLIATYSSGNPKGVVVSCRTHADAQAWLGANLHPHDVVLVENDLPDLYEKKLAL